MSASTAIGMVSESLQDMLVTEMAVTPSVPVTVLGPDEPAADRRVNLLLYKVTENTFLKNIDWQVRPGTADRLTPPPLSLKLSYLLTAYAPNDPYTGNATAHALLGEAMRVFHDNPVVTDEFLVRGLRGAPEEIRVVHVPLDLEELSRIWSTFTRPYHVSACYEVSVVQLDAKGTVHAPSKRVRRIGVPDPQAPFHPPTVTAMTPMTGPPGTAVRFSGEHLSGWRAAVRVTGRSVVQGLELTGDSFDVTLPAGLERGFHEVRVDVSGLFRRVFAFEVSP
ncbi:DUF4255 domain-containing protein [Actinomadura miaoliensis]|uniref:Pvc16 N-terminal domain-containing protein n=1 Tax=Actinomadura miaoliensis TaxID=430685 RepID=A0ABP7WS44_9ACTN